MEAGLCRSGRTRRAARPVVGWPRHPESGPPAGRGKAAALGHQEAVGGDAQGGVMVEAAPATALEVAEPQLLLELLEVAQGPPAQLRRGDELLDRGRLGQGREPVLARLLLRSEE